MFRKELESTQMFLIILGCGIFGWMYLLLVVSSAWGGGDPTTSMLSPGGLQFILTYVLPIFLWVGILYKIPIKYNLISLVFPVGLFGYAIWMGLGVIDGLRDFAELFFLIIPVLMAAYALGGIRVILGESSLKIKIPFLG